MCVYCVYYNCEYDLNLNYVLVHVSTNVGRCDDHVVDDVSRKRYGLQSFFPVTKTTP